MEVVMKIRNKQRTIMAKLMDTIDRNQSNIQVISTVTVWTQQILPSVSRKIYGVFGESMGMFCGVSGMVLGVIGVARSYLSTCGQSGEQGFMMADRPAPTLQGW